MEVATALFLGSKIVRRLSELVIARGNTVHLRRTVLAQWAHRISLSWPPCIACGSLVLFCLTLMKALRLDACVPCHTAGFAPVDIDQPWGAVGQCRSSFWTNCGRPLAV